jgi:hypothetical protein
MTKPEIIEKLTELEIEFDPKAGKAELEALLPEGGSEGGSEGNTGSDSGIEVGDPMDLRPKNLPLVVKLGANASSAQKEYAKVLNGYAYQNPKKWKAKKEELIKRLESLAGKEVSSPALDGEGRPNQILEVNKSVHAFNFLHEKGGPVSTLPDAE